MVLRICDSKTCVTNSKQQQHPQNYTCKYSIMLSIVSHTFLIIKYNLMVRILAESLYLSISVIQQVSSTIHGRQTQLIKHRNRSWHAFIECLNVKSILGFVFNVVHIAEPYTRRKCQLAKTCKHFSLLVVRRQISLVFYKSYVHSALLCILCTHDENI